MWAIVFGAPEAIIFRGTHLVFAMALGSSFYRRTGAPARRAPTLLDYALLGLARPAGAYLFVNYDYLVNRIYYIDDLTWSDTIMGMILVVMISRRRVA